MEDLVYDRAEESPEQVLARLERYVESLRVPPPVVVPVERRVTVVDVAVPASPAPLIDTLIPSRIATREESPPRRRRFMGEIAPALTAVTICSLVILVSEWFAVWVAAMVGVALMLVGVAGLVRRVPLARAYTFGLVIAALLIRLS